MLVIAVRIPQEIRKYKEKILLGLTARQLLSTMIALIICVPIYFYGRGKISEDLLSWLIIILAIPFVSIGFFNFNGMPMEKFIVAFVKSEVLYPQKRKYKSENAFREWERMADKEDIKIYGRPSLKEKIEASLERAYLLAEAEEKNIENFDVDKIELITVKDRRQSGNNPKKDKKDKKKKNKKSLLEKKVEEIERKQAENSYYVLSNSEFRVMKKWKQMQLEERKKEIEKGKKELAKKSASMKKRRRAKTSIPTTVQKTIPYIADYEEGMFEVAPNKFSKMYKIKDINYKTAKEEEQVTIFCKLGEFLNYFSEEMHFAFCIDNRIISSAEQERKVFYQLTGDKYDKHRREYNSILRRQIMAGRNNIQVEKFLTVTIDADTPIEALLKFHKIDAEIINNLRRIGSDATVLSTTERLAYYHDKFRRGHEGEFQIDYDFIKMQGISSKDYIAPTSFIFKNKYFKIDDGYYRCLFLNNLPASLSDEFLWELYNNDFPVTVSLSIKPVSQEKGLRIVRKQLTGIEANKIEAEKRAIRAGYNPETIQHSIKDAHAQAEALYDDMLNKNQKMFFVTITCMVYGESLEELDQHTDILMSKARKYTCQLQILTMQQEEGFKVTMPFGYPPKDLCVDRALTTEGTAIFMPFANQELFQPGGFYYGLNQISHNLIVCNRTAMKTPSGFVLGSSGSGKSFATKREILNVLLNDSETSVLIIDPENEYGDFCRAFGGTVVKISADTMNYINPMDMPPDYGLDEDDPEDTPLATKKSKAIKKKSEYIMSIVERMISVEGPDTTGITPQQKTIIDRCVYRCYKDYLDHDFDINYLPTLQDFQNELDKEKEESEDGRLIAEAVEYYTRGSLDIFAHKTNIDVDNRLVVFNVRDLGEQLRQIALIIVFDFIWNRMIANKNKGIRTYCYCDEIHVMFQSYYSAYFLRQLYKRGRKYGLCITGITQNVEDLLRSELARGMIGNSDFIMMLNQASEDLKILASILNISETEMGFVMGAEAGSGLLFAENVIVPFIDRFPTDSYLYRLMSTKFGEEMSKEEIDRQINEIMASTENKEEDNQEQGKVDDFFTENVS